MDLSRQYVKFCDVADFADERLLATVRSIVPERDPRTHIERKVWEMAMLALFLEDVGRLDGAAEVLSVGAGTERILYWLTNRTGRVVATDIYGTGPFAHQEADGRMVSDPGAFAPAYETDLDRLDVRVMDARQLDFPDASFDVVYSLSSIEHFGSPRDIARAAREMGRVLRPGGQAVIATDAFVKQHPLDSALADTVVRAATLGRRYRKATPRRRARLGEVLTKRELSSLIVGPSGLRLLQRLDDRVSPASWQACRRIDAVDRRAVSPAETYPMVLLRARRSIFGSVLLALQKPRP